MSNTSIGRGPAHGGNENHDGDPLHKTLGEAAPADEPPVGNDLVDQAVPDMPAPDGPKVRARQSQPDAVRGKLPPGSHEPTFRG